MVSWHPSGALINISTAGGRKEHIYRHSGTAAAQAPVARAACAPTASRLLSMNCGPKLVFQLPIWATPWRSPGRSPWRSP